jgi:hypothetical protein
MSFQTSKKPAPGTSGTTCTKTGLYKASDGKIEFVVQVEKGKPFPKFPGGSGTSNTTWTAVGSSDSDRSSFEAVKVAAGTM